MIGRLVDVMVAYPIMAHRLTRLLRIIPYLLIAATWIATGWLLWAKYGRTR